MTVQYEKIVPLLVEAIKELSDKVSALEDKSTNIKEIRYRDLDNE